MSYFDSFNCQKQIEEIIDEEYWDWIHSSEFEKDEVEMDLMYKDFCERSIPHEESAEELPF